MVTQHGAKLHRLTISRSALPQPHFQGRWCLLEASMALPPCSCELMSCSQSARDPPDAHVRHGGVQAAVYTVGEDRPTPHRQLLATGAPDGLPSARQSRQLLLELHPHPALGIQLLDKNGCRARQRGTRSSSTQVFTAQPLGWGFQERAVMCRQALQVRMERCDSRAAEGLVGARGDTGLISGSLHQGDPRGASCSNHTQKKL